MIIVMQYRLFTAKHLGGNVHLQLSGSFQWGFLSGNSAWDGRGPERAAVTNDAEWVGDMKQAKRARLSLSHQVMYWLIQMLQLSLILS